MHLIEKNVHFMKVVYMFNGYNKLPLVNVNALIAIINNKQYICYGIFNIFV